jgi:hypothetical protein
MEAILTPRWFKLNNHAEQRRYRYSERRFNIAHAGRRGGKTEIAKRRLIERAMDCERPQGRFVFGAPTHRQAVDIFWDDTIAMIPRWALYGKTTRSISISYRRIKLFNGACVEVCGLDKPERIEGPPLDGFVGDEFGNFKPTVWGQNIRPALSTLGREGWADLIGVPEGKNHYFQLVEDVRDKEDWDIFTWLTKEINPEEAEAARGDLDELTYEQEYGGEFISFKGRCYYTFNQELNCPPKGERVLYNPAYPLYFCFDFNRIPGNCCIVQELPAPPWLIKRNGADYGTVICVIDEVFITQDSHTEKICDILIQRWGHHKGLVHLYGDATGGAHTSSGIRGSDWDIIKEKFEGVFDYEMKVRRGNPAVRVRINSVNSALVAADGKIGTIIDPKCKFLIRDLEGVTCDDEGTILKSDAKSLLTHISDAFGYFVYREHPYGGVTSYAEGEW